VVDFKFNGGMQVNDLCIRMLHDPTPITGSPALTAEVLREVVSFPNLRLGLSSVAFLLKTVGRGFRSMLLLMATAIAKLWIARRAGGNFNDSPRREADDDGRCGRRWQ
jgi:hypothetical protein